MEDYWGKTKKLFFHTGEFIKSIADEKDYIPIFLYFIVLYLLGSVVQSFSTAILGIPLAMVFIGLIIGLLLAVFTAVVLPLISSGIAHLGVLLLGGRQGFFNTFKPITYACCLFTIYGMIGSILFALLSLFVRGQIARDEMMAQTPVMISNIPSMIMIGVLIVFWVWALAHTIYLEISGISIYQNLSKLKAFVAVVIIPLVIVLVLFFLLGLSIHSLAGPYSTLA